MTKTENGTSVVLRNWSAMKHPDSGKDMSLSEQVAYFARISNPGNQQLNQNFDRLLKYLIRNNHWSPFELVSLGMEITTTRDIARQILRHRSFSFQEFSQRYANSLKNFDMITRECRLQDSKNRQNSIEIEDAELHEKWELMQNNVGAESIKSYNWAIENGIAKEQARAVLPEGMVPSKLYMNGTLRSWMHYIAVRAGLETQKEHRTVAQMVAIEINRVFPELLYFQTNT